MTTTTLLLIGAAILNADPPAPVTTPPAADDRPHVVFISGDEEYRSEESLPRFAELLARDHDVRTTVLHSLDAEGRIDLDAAEAMITPAHKLVAFAHVSNVLGSVLDAARAVRLAGTG